MTVTPPARAAISHPGIALRAGDRFPLDVVVGDPTSLEGTITDPDDAPVSGALVEASTGFGWGRGPGGGTRAAARADSGGRYRLDDVAPGPVRVSARRDESSPPTLRMVNVEEGTTTTVDLVVVSGGVVTGTVLDARSAPLPGAWVAAFRGAGARPNSGWTVADATGRYVLPLAPGSYGLTASPGRPGRRPDPSAVLASATVVAGGQGNVDLVVPDDPQPTLSGVVLEPGGAPSPGAAVRLIPSGSQPQLVIAGDDGSFQSAVPDGDVAVSARNGGRLGNAAAAAPAAGLVVQLAPAASIAGRLVGEPAPETSSVSASTLDAMQAGRGAGTVQFVGATFSLTDVAPGQLALHVATDDGRAGDARATIAPGENRSLDVTLSAAALVSGRVVSAATSQPVTLVRITVDGQPRRRGLGADGRFHIAVTEGPHHLGIAALGYVAIARDVTASAASAVDLGDLALDAAAPTPSTTGR